MLDDYHLDNEVTLQQVFRRGVFTERDASALAGQFRDWAEAERASERLGDADAPDDDDIRQDNYGREVFDVDGRDVSALAYAAAERALERTRTGTPPAADPDEAGEWRQCLICKCYEAYKYTAGDSCHNDGGRACAYAYYCG